MLQWVKIEMGKEVMRVKKLWLGLVAVLAAVVLTGCQPRLSWWGSEKVAEKVAEKTIEKSTGGKAKVDLDKGEVRIKTEEGEVVMKGDLPENMPQDVPVYPGATVAGSWQVTEEEGGGLTLNLQTEDEVEKVVAFYKERLPEEGWEIKSEFQNEGAVVITVEKGERGGWVSVSREEGKTVIGLMFGEGIE